MNITPISGRLSTIARRAFIIAAVLSISLNVYSAWKTWRGEILHGDIVGIAEVATGSSPLDTVSTLAVETREGFIGKKHIFACGEVVDKSGDGLRLTFLGDVYGNSPKVDFRPINVTYTK